MRRVAAAGVMLQIVVHDLDWKILGADFRKELFWRAEHQRWEVRIVVQALDTLDVFLGRATAVIADAIEAHQFVERRFEFIGIAPDVLVEFLAPRAVFKRDAER